MPPFALTNAYLALGALVALALHIWVGRMAVATPASLCKSCRRIRADLEEILGDVMALAPTTWLFYLFAAMLTWPLVALLLLFTYTHRCSRKES
ncbi:hypothetical protein [Nocardiopsis synnemataformans]|uniref:hypothetical protein n=1 Tax=Nocardiopsis synnemataformans TaxID=61305 RepID=UPI003EC1306E